MKVYEVAVCDPEGHYTCGIYASYDKALEKCNTLCKEAIDRYSTYDVMQDFVLAHETAIAQNEWIEAPGYDIPCIIEHEVIE